MSTATLPAGRSDARFETTAAMAETEASTNTLSKEVQQNAAKLHTAAVDAAHTAEMESSSTGTAVEKLEKDLSHKTDVAAAQGAADVTSVSATATGYVDQAKALAGNAIASVQTYVSTSTPPQADRSVSGTNGGATTTVQSAITTGKEYLASAQATAQPYVASATAAVQPYVESASAAAQPHLEKARATVAGVMGSTTSGTASTTDPSAPPA